MSKFFLGVRIILLLVLLFLLAAVFWGLANREKTAASGNEAYSEQYDINKPAAYTPYLLVGLIIVGLFVTVASIFFEYHQYRSGAGAPRSPQVEKDAERERWY